MFERSRLMDHLSSYTFADDLFPGPLTHYCVCGEDHVVDVVTTATPQVRLLTADEVAALNWGPNGPHGVQNVRSMCENMKVSPT